jgi:hypothetical protein
MSGELKDLVEEMRTLGIAHYKTQELEITLVWGPQWEKQPSAPEEKKEEVKEVDKDPKVGVDGMTAEEQKELYGKVLG